MSYLFDDFSKLPNTKREGNESFKDIDNRSPAQMSCYSAYGSSIALPPSIAALLLLANAKVCDSQRVPILSAASAKASTSATADLMNDDLIRLVEYEAIASIIRQCDNGSRSSSRPSSSVHDSNLSSNTVNTPTSSPSNNTISASCHKRTMNNKQLRLHKLMVRCNDYGKYGHFASDHNADGSIKYDISSNSASPSNNRNRGQNKDNNRNAVLNFGVVSSCRGSDSSSSSHLSTPHAVSSFETNQTMSAPLGPMIDGGAPYSVIGVTERFVLRSSLGRPRLDKNDPMPTSFARYKFRKYGNGSHSSGERPIFGSGYLTCRSDSGCPVAIRHLVIAGSSQWPIVRNITRSCNQLRIDDNRIQFTFFNGVQDYLSVDEVETHD